ncbi:MAG: lipopolysaccharide biosynthesis protein [Alistipes sp.]|jgi:O-antigen/teichoic acid export membrane protein|nr:lipopolysaccharide biosynthesis protein [Alistipes sp.]
MAAELKGKVVRGFAWNVAERVASALFQAWVAINVANRLFPEDYAMKAIFAAFVVVFNSFVDSGFSQALIRNRDASKADYSSAFWFNMVVSGAVYGVLVGLAYPASRLLDMPDLVLFAPVFFLVVPLGALGIIQQTVLTREFDFRRLSLITFCATVCSGVVSVVLAWNGFGFWAIAAQRVVQTAVKSLLLWVFGRWRPSMIFSGESIRRMFGYSSRLLGTDLLNNLYASIPQFIIGRIHGPTLGNYEQARQIRDLPLNSAMTSMQSVTFPALASVSGDDDKFARSVGRVVGAIVFLMFPMMAGMVVVAEELFGMFLAPQWQASVPFFQILCLGGFATPLAIVSSNILRTRSDGRAVLRAEMVRKTLATVILAATIPLGIFAITWGVVAIAFADAAVSFFAARRESAYGFRALARDLLPVLGLTLVMAFAVILVGAVVVRPVLWAGSFVSAKFALGLLLGIKVLTGAVVYLFGAALLRLSAFREFTELLGKIVGRVRS